MKTVYLHIGTPKTGTTSLQKVLGANRDAMLAHGYYFPKTGILSSTQGHHMLAWAIQGGNRKVEVLRGEKLELDNVWSKLLAEIESVDAENIILSTEYFTHLIDHSQIELVRKNLLNYKVKIVLCLRRQDQYMLSSYAEAVKAGYGKSFSKFFEEKRHYCDYLACIKRWEDIFGQGSVLVQLFKKGYGKETLQEFFDNIGLSNLRINDLKFSDRRLNVTPPGKLIRILCGINFISKEILSLPFSFQKRTYLYYLQQGKVVRLFSRLPDFPISDQIISESTADYIQKEFALINQLIAKRYFPEKGSSLF